MGAGVFNGRVRDGIGFWARRSSHQTGATQVFWDEGVAGFCDVGCPVRQACDSQDCRWSFRDRVRVLAWPACAAAEPVTDTDHGGDQVDRAISTGQLNASPRLHFRPIDVVVFHGPQGRSRFKGGFPLRCLQRLSRPYIAMLHCRWRDNSSTRGTFIPVLSY